MDKYFCPVGISLCLLHLVSNWSCQGQSTSNFSTSAVPHSNHSFNTQFPVNNNPERCCNSTHPKLDKLFGVDSRIFEEYLKDEDLSTIPGLREDDDFENWIPPLWAVRDFPSYISGFDSENRPIWVAEYGKFTGNLGDVNNKEIIALAEKQLRFTALLHIKSQALRSTKEHRVTQYVLIRDFAGFKPEYLTNRTLLRIILKMVSNRKRHMQKYIAKAITINVSPVVEILINLISPFYLHSVSKNEVYGTNKNIWGPQLLKHFPKDQLPEWYGGNKGYKPYLNFYEAVLKYNRSSQSRCYGK